MYWKHQQILSCKSKCISSATIKIAIELSSTYSVKRLFFQVHSHKFTVRDARYFVSRLWVYRKFSASASKMTMVFVLFLFRLEHSVTSSSTEKLQVKISNYVPEACCAQFVQTSLFLSRIIYINSFSILCKMFASVFQFTSQAFAIGCSILRIAKFRIGINEKYYGKFSLSNWIFLIACFMHYE